MAFTNERIERIELISPRGAFTNKLSVAVMNEDSYSVAFRIEQPLVWL